MEFPIGLEVLGCAYKAFYFARATPQPMQPHLITDDGLE